MNVKLLQCGNEVVCGMAAATCVRSDNPEKSLKVYEIEPEIVYEASKYFNGAKEFLDGKTKEEFNP